MEMENMPRKSALAYMKASKPKCISNNQKNQNVTIRNTYEG